MAQSAFVLKKVQDAFRTYLRYDGPAGSNIRDWLPTTSVVCGISRGAQDDEKEPVEQDVSVPLPRVVIECNSATHTAHTSGQFRAVVTIRLEESADETSETTHLKHAGEVYNHVFTNYIAADLTSALEDFTAQLVIFQDQAYALDERLWSASFNLEVECLGRDIA